MPALSQLAGPLKKVLEGVSLGDVKMPPINIVVGGVVVIVGALAAKKLKEKKEKKK